MKLEDIKLAKDNHQYFKIPIHKRFYVYPPAVVPECHGDGIIVSIEDQTTAQALIIVCNICRARWGASLATFPDLNAMDSRHGLLDPHHAYPLLPELQASLDQDEENYRNTVANSTKRWERPLNS